jgi:Asp-tRNA(Asn)/Glu-tRNA(Gln) amidotransferase A subunit family amidase
VDSIHGPCRNIWQSGENCTLVRDGECATSAVELQGCTKVGCREVHQLSLGGGSSPTEQDDWFIAGGSSGGCAVAVASGSVFA